MTDDKRPREWTLYANGQWEGIGWEPRDEFVAIRVTVDKFAYDELQAKLAKAEAEIEKLNTLVEKCRSANVEQVNWNIDKSQELRQEREISAMLREALEDVERQCNDSSVVCRKCGDEETLQDSDIAYSVRDALAREKEMRK